MDREDDHIFPNGCLSLHIVWLQDPEIVIHFINDSTVGHSD